MTSHELICDNCDKAYEIITPPDICDACETGNYGRDLLFAEGIFVLLLVGICVGSYVYDYFYEPD